MDIINVIDLLGTILDLIKDQNVDVEDQTELVYGNVTAILDGRKSNS